MRGRAEVRNIQKTCEMQITLLMEDSENLYWPVSEQVKDPVIISSYPLDSLQANVGLKCLLGLNVLCYWPGCSSFFPRHLTPRSSIVPTPDYSISSV